MSYRKIQVDGQEFEYSIGRTHTKIRHVGAFSNTEVGVRRQIQWGDDMVNTIQVRPSDLANFIKQNNLKAKQ